MSEEHSFQVGDEVEVLPCTEGGALHELAHCQVAGRRGTVLIVRDGGRSVGVHFPGLCGNNLFGKITTTTGWWCDPAWLRRVERWEDLPRTFDVDGDWYVAYGKIRLRLTEDGKPLRYQAVPHNTPSRPQDARSAPEASRARPGPRYKVGDLVDMGPFSRGEVREVIAELTYMVRWPDGYEYSIKESTLSPHGPAPVVCTPDGTRCAWMADQPAGSVHVLGWLYCPGCGGKLTAGG